MGLIAAAGIIAAAALLPRGTGDVPAPGTPDTTRTWNAPGHAPADTDYPSLSVFEPLPPGFGAGVEDSDPSRSARHRAVDAYHNGDYEAARAAFGLALAEEPGDVETLLFIGSCEGMMGNAAAAATYLQLALVAAQEPALRDEALWQFANAKLATRDVTTAREALAAIVEGAGPHADRARDVLAALGP